MRQIIEYIKLVVAYCCVFGVVVVPIPSLLLLVYRYHGTRYGDIVMVVSAFAALPLFFGSLFLSFRLGEWFLNNWGNKYVQ